MARLLRVELTHCRIASVEHLARMKLAADRDEPKARGFGFRFADEVAARSRASLPGFVSPAKEVSVMNVAVREESPFDIAAIHAVTAAAFRNAPHTDHNEPFIVDALRKARALSVSLVAEQDGAIVAHVAVSPVTVSDGSCGWYGLGPISVLPEFQGRGIGSRLMRDALQRLRQMGAAGCVLLGDPSFYARFGFKAEPGIVLPDAPPECFQALSFGPALPRGVVAYHESFAARG